MPVEQLGPRRFRWGKSGKIYPTLAQAEAQGRAAFANGYREDARARAELHRVLSASKRAESAYVLAIHAVMRRTHASVLEHVGAPGRHDARRADATSDDRFLRRLFVLQRPEVEKAFNAMASTVNASSAKGAALVGIRPGDVPGLAAVIAEARERNVRLIQSASTDFLGQVRGVLDEFGGMHPGKGAGPKRLAALLKAPGPGEETAQPRDLTEAVQARVGVSRSRANLIARDQTTKLAGALNKHRQTAAGVRSFRWSSSKDERVRASHRELDGRVFSWDEGIPGDVADEVGEEPGATPGSPVSCRCVATPVLAELEAPAESEEEPEATPEPAPEEQPLPMVARGLEDLGAHFRSVFEDPRASMSAADIVSAMPHQGVARWVSQNQPAIAVVPNIRDAQGVWYPNGQIFVMTDVRDPTEALPLGKTWRIADTRATKAEMVQSTFMHELGHHVHLWSSDHGRPAVNDIVRAAWDRLGVDPERTLRIQRGYEPSPAVSRYAVNDRDEYFAESFNAYLVDRDGLERHDPIGFKMVRDVLRELGIEGEKPIGRLPVQPTTHTTPHASRDRR